MLNDVHGIFLVGVGVALPDRGLLQKESAASSAPTNRTAHADLRMERDGDNIDGKTAPTSRTPYSGRRRPLSR